MNCKMHDLVGRDFEKSIVLMSVLPCIHYEALSIKTLTSSPRYVAGPPGTSTNGLTGQSAPVYNHYKGALSVISYKRVWPICSQAHIFKDACMII